MFAELGTHNGFSYFAFCEAVQRLRLDTKCFAVDTWKGDDHAGFYGEEVFAEVRQTNEEYAGFSTLLRGYFDDHVDSFEDGSIDLLHIDGRHGYEDVKHDFESWLPKMSDRGVVVFHDIAVFDRGFGVYKFWEELSSRYRGFYFEHGYGLGVLAVDKDPTEGMTRLFDASPAEADAIRAFYAGRGQLVSRQYHESAELAQARAEVTELAQTRATVTELADELHTIKSSLAWKSTRPLRWLFGLVPLSVRRKIRPN